MQVGIAIAVRKKRKGGGKFTGIKLFIEKHSPNELAGGWSCFLFGNVLVGFLWNAVYSFSRRLHSGGFT